MPNASAMDLVVHALAGKDAERSQVDLLGATDDVHPALLRQFCQPAHQRFEITGIARAHSRRRPFQFLQPRSIFRYMSTMLMTTLPV